MYSSTVSPTAGEISRMCGISRPSSYFTHEVSGVIDEYRRYGAKVVFIGERATAAEYWSRILSFYVYAKDALRPSESTAACDSGV